MDIHYGYNPEDVARLYELEKACFNRAFQWSKADLIAALKTMDTWIGTDGSQIAGYAMCEIEDKGVHVITLEVAPEFRRRGLGEALMGAVEYHYKKKRIKRVNLEVHVDNPAQLLYFKLGYRVTGVKEGYYGNGSMAISMSKTLKRVYTHR